MAAIDAACRDLGFFYVVGHGVPRPLQDRLEAAAARFFAEPADRKAAIAMARGGRAWRGWFPVGGELTSGRPDRKEGLYFGQEIDAADPRVRAGRPLHGPNLFPEHPADLRPAVLEYLRAVTAVGQTVLGGIAMALGLERGWFQRHLTADPLVLFRIFHYPPTDGDPEAWGVGEHTDYGLITLLRQDDSGGLEVRGAKGWIDAPPVADSFVVNLGDMLELMTAGRYRSTPHRVRNRSGGSRLSFPLFLDPGWDVEVPVLDLPPGTEPVTAPPRWDGQDVLAWKGTYGEYVLSKVTKVFPRLGDDVL